MLNLKQFVRPLASLVVKSLLLCKLLTYGSLLLEFAGPALLFVPFQSSFSYIRSLVVLMMASFHLGIFATMSIGDFPLVSIASWIFVIPGLCLLLRVSLILCTYM